MRNEDEDVMVLLYPRPEWDSEHGRIRVEDRLVALDVTPVNGSSRLRLSVLLADQVRADPETFQFLLDAAAADHAPAEVWFDEENHCIRAEALVPPTRPGGRVPDETTPEFEHFTALLNDERLHWALGRCKGRVLGTPADLFEGPEL